MVIQTIFEEKINATQKLLNSLQKEVGINPQYQNIVETLAGNLEELRASAEEVHRNHTQLSDNYNVLAQERQKYQQLFEFTPNGYLLSNANGRIQEINHVCAQYLNLSKEALLGKPLTLFIKKSYISSFHTLLQRLSENHQTVEWETMIQPRDKAAFPALLSVASDYDIDGKIIGLRWLIRDLTEVKQREAQAQQEQEKLRKVKEQQRILVQTQLQVQELQKLRKLKKDFLDSLSHELRTPMSNIKVALHLCKDIMPPQGQRYLDILEQECNREIELIQRLLVAQSFDKTPVSKTVSLELIQMDQWLPKIVAKFQRAMETKDQMLTLSIAPNLSSFMIEATNFQLIVEELLNNICKYTPVGEHIRVLVQSGINSSPNRPTQSISFISTQPMIPTDELTRIFDPFYRALKGDMYSYSGVGIGLFLVRKLIEQMEGTIQVKSTAQRTIFSIEIPQQSSMAPTEVTIQDRVSEEEVFELVYGLIKSSNVI